MPSVFHVERKSRYAGALCRYQIHKLQTMHVSIRTPPISCIGKSRITIAYSQFPILMCASFAIELYLKSLAAFSVEYLDDEPDPSEESAESATKTACNSDDEIEDSDVYRVTASPVEFGHELLTLYNCIDDQIRQQMELQYRSETRREFVADLTPYDKIFEDTRYCFEKSGGNSLDAVSISRIVGLSAFVSDFVICLLRKNT